MTNSPVTGGEPAGRLAGNGEGFLASRDRPLILYVIQHTDYSGAETAQLPLLAADADPLLACPAGSQTEQLARSVGVPTADLPFRPLRHSAGRRRLLRSVVDGLRSARDLRAILRSHPRRRLVYATSLRPSLLAAVAGLGLGRRAVWVVTDFLPPAPLRPLIRLLALVSRARVVAHSGALGEDFAGRWRPLHRRLLVLHPGIDVERFASVPIGGRGPRAGVFGHISPTKRTDLALAVAARVAGELPEFELDIVGRAQYRDEDFAFEQALREQVAADERLRASVRFRGYADRVEEAFARISVLLHCRPDEPFGMVLIEAMAAGLPVVAPAAGGPLEIVEHGRTGLLYPPGDADVAAAHVLALLRDPDRTAAMGRAARDAARLRFNAQGHVRVLERTLAQLAP